MNCATPGPKIRNNNVRSVLFLCGIEPAMNDCQSCAQALPVVSCATSLKIGEVADRPEATFVVRFTDRATGHVTIVGVDGDMVPTIVAITRGFDFVPDNSVLVEVMELGEDGAMVPVEFYPFEWIDGAAAASVYPVVCIVFTPVKSFGADGSLYAQRGSPAAGPRALIIES